MAADPMYRQIAADLRSKIEAGELPRGAQLPTEIELRRTSTKRPVTPSGTRSNGSSPAVWSRPGRARARSWSRRSRPFVSTLTGDPETGFGGGEG